MCRKRVDKAAKYAPEDIIPRGAIVPGGLYKDIERGWVIAPYYRGVLNPSHGGDRFVSVGGKAEGVILRPKKFDVQKASYTDFLNYGPLHHEWYLHPENPDGKPWPTILLPEDSVLVDEKGVHRMLDRGGFVIWCESDPATQAGGIVYLSPAFLEATDVSPRLVPAPAQEIETGLHTTAAEPVGKEMM